MRLAARGPEMVVLAVAAATLAACGSPARPTTIPQRPRPTPAATGTPAGGGPAPSVATLQAIYAQIDPANGQRCVGKGTTPSWSACPLTPRLVAALEANLAARSGPGADPLCGCQAYDPQQQVTYSVAAGGGTIRVVSFGAPEVTYTVVAAGSAYLIDDIVYCSPAPHSIYPGEAVTSC